uniref:Nucleotide-diphospho-sugar transferase domain-containing protein n=1 Tax=Brassica campestris TaxID=3711 RepID=M4EFL3_BRACM
MNAAMEDKTVIITALNEAWVAPNSMFDLFLESFHIGIGTEKYLKHVIGVCVDNKAYERCLHLHPHCYLINATDYDQLSGPNNYMTPGYLKLVWRRMEFLREVLALGYNFLFTDADILWFRDPFPRFFPDVDFQIACDHYKGNSSSKSNWVNSGFTYVKANNKTIKFYEFWCGSRWRFRGRRKHDQEVFNLIKRDPFVDQIGIKMRFLDTLHIGTFCEPSKDVNVVNTMHADCCKGLNNKVSYLNAVLRDWKQYLSESFLGNTKKAEARWRRRHRCGLRVR